MDVGSHYKLIILLFLLLLSAFFSGSEVALFSINGKRIKNNLNDHPVIRRYVLYLLEYPRRLLVTILIGNTVVNVAASIVAVALALDYAKNSSMSKNLVLSIQIIVLTIIIIIFGELIPKVWASKQPLSFAKAVSIPLYWMCVIFYPVAETITEVIKLSVSKVKIDKSKMAIQPDEITELATLSHERGAIIEDEHGLIHGIVGFKSVYVHEVMTPRVDISSISLNTDFKKVLNIVNSSGHSRIPLCEDNLDQILGILYAKDLLPYLRNGGAQKQISLSKIARKAIFVPETKKINDLMHELQEKKTHIAIVVDEYGGTSGLITLEDILEEIIGEIRDEYDREENTVTKLSDNIYLVLGKTSIDELNELLNSDIIMESENFDTVGGLVLKVAGHIPREGYTFQLQNYKFSVKEILNKRIKTVLIEKIHSE